ncbi:hypothetical protein ACP4OV_014016 [Aristida adscensionis]
MAPPHGPSLLLLACAASLLLLSTCHRAGAAVYVVGGEASGWVDSGVNYAAWARQYTFTVGDVLVFQYVRSQHNVYEVTESTFRTCDTGGGRNGVRAKYATGNDRVALDEARGYWFICDFPGHCLGGMRFAVNVSGGGGGGGLPPALPPPLDGSSAASPAAGGRRGWVAWALGVLVLMNWAR